MTRRLPLALLGLLLATPALAAPGQELQGVVTDERGAPLAGATVEAWWNIRGSTGHRPSGAAKATTTSDAAGGWTLRCEQRPRSWLVVVSADGRAPRGLELDGEALARPSPIVVHALGLRPLDRRAGRPAPARWPLRVEDADGAPCRDLPVELRVDRWYGVDVVTDDEGRCAPEVALVSSALRVRFDLPPRRGWLEPRRAFLELVRSAPRPGDELVLRLPRLDARLEGETDLGLQQRPHGLMSDVAEVAFESDDGSLRLVAETSQGSFTLSVPDGATGWLVARPLSRASFCGNGLVPFEAPPVRVPVMAGAKNVVLRVPDGALAGRVVGPTGLGVGEAQVRVRLPSGEELSLLTSWSGEFDLWCLPPGTVTARVDEPAGRGQARVEVVAGQRTPVVVVLAE